MNDEQNRIAEGQDEAGAGAPSIWRSLEELEGSPRLRELLEREFPEGASEWADGSEGEDGVSRRNFMMVMGASLALMGLQACTKMPDEKIVPYVHPPEGITPGVPLYFASTMPFRGYARGVLAKSHMGRPVNVQGNPDHPDALGASDIFMQASVLTLYDPDRSQVLTRVNSVSTWDAFVHTMSGEIEKWTESKGAGVRILTETITSPSLAGMIRQFLAKYPQAKWHTFEPVNRANERGGALAAFGEDAQAVYHFDKADVIVALDANFLFGEPGSLRYARQFSDRRRVRKGRAEMNRLYAVESTPTITGAVADHRLVLKPSEIAKFARELGRQVGADVGTERGGTMPQAYDGWIAGLVRDLEGHRSSSLVIAGREQPAEVHAVAHAINRQLGNVGSTVTYVEPIEANAVDQYQSLRELAGELEAGAVDTLFVLDSNVVYDAPADLGLHAELPRNPLNKARLRVHMGMYDDETSFYCHWHIPQSHYLESWGDARAFDGTTSVTQPLIAPLYQTRSPHELLALLLGKRDRSNLELVREHWQKAIGGADFERVWLTALEKGVIEGTALVAKNVTLKGANEAAATTQPAGAGSGAGAAGNIELIIRPDTSVLDGRWANNAWLQELPKQITRLTWENAALLSPKTAGKLGLRINNPIEREPSQVVEIASGGRSVKAAVWIVPGHAEDCVTLHLGYGRRRAGRVGSGIGVNAYTLQSSDSPWWVPQVTVRLSSEERELACTQHHQVMSEQMKNRELVRSLSQQQLAAGDYSAVHPEQKRISLPQYVGEHYPQFEEGSLYPGWEYKNLKWGMAIDMTACIGCNACVTACQSENNIPVVGREQVIRGREMHWLRIDTYHGGGADNPETYFQPIPCMHCENAPCELVCPVGATTHSDEGINEMTYNRCVGTRYCSNNCPYKVRRFNYLQYNDETSPVLKMLRNPDVTVRSRGVMEKCTYCIQRIDLGRIEMKKHVAKMAEARDDEERGALQRQAEQAIRSIETACQQACPTQAIVFGDLNRADMAVTMMQNDPLNYRLLEELNTKPRTSYLARVWNRNPEMPGEGRASVGGMEVPGTVAGLGRMSRSTTPPVTADRNVRPTTLSTSTPQSERGDA